MASKLKWINHKSTFFDILKAQRGTSKYTDATLAVDGNFYPVHKLVMSTCSDYFSEIFERTACKAPVIVLKDVQCHDIEALLDYMYLGEVDVEQDKLTSLLKTAESLKIKGLGVPEKSQIKSHNNSISSDDDPCAKPYSPPAKKRKHDDSNITWPAIPGSSFEKESTRLDSNMALVNPNQPQTSSITSPNIRKESEPMVVKVELDDSREGEVNLRKDNIYAADIVETVHDPGEGSGYDVIKKEHEPEDFDFTSVPGPSAQKFTESDTVQKESLVVKVGLAGTSNDPLGGDNASAVFNTEQNQGYYGSTTAPGAFLPQNLNLPECYKLVIKLPDPPIMTKKAFGYVKARAWLSHWLPLIIGSRPGYKDESKRPTWWSTNIPWKSVNAGGFTRNQMVQLVLDLYAHYGYQRDTLHVEFEVETHVLELVQAE